MEFSLCRTIWYSCTTVGHSTKRVGSPLRYRDTPARKSGIGSLNNSLRKLASATFRDGASSVFFRGTTGTVFKGLVELSARLAIPEQALGVLMLEHYSSIVLVSPSSFTPPPHSSRTRNVNYFHKSHPPISHGKYLSATSALSHTFRSLLPHRVLCHGACMPKLSQERCTSHR